MTHVWHATRQKSPKSHCYEAPWIFIHKREHTWGSQWQGCVGEPLHLSLMWLWTLDDEHASHVQSSGRARRRELGVEECITIVQYGAGSFPGANANPCLAYVSNIRSGCKFRLHHMQLQPTRCMVHRLPVPLDTPEATSQLCSSHSNRECRRL